MKKLIIAISKGALFKNGITLLEQAGYNFPDSHKDSRKLYIEDSQNQVRLLIVRPWDVPVYVAEGAADIYPTFVY